MLLRVKDDKIDKLIEYFSKNFGFRFLSDVETLHCLKNCNKFIKYITLKLFLTPLVLAVWLTDPLLDTDTSTIQPPVGVDLLTCL